MARDILCTLAASTNVERIFSYAGQVCSSRRGQLKFETIRNIMLVFASQKAKHTLSKAEQATELGFDDLTPDQQEIELQWREKAMEKFLTGVVDLFYLGHSLRR
jgi:hAT family C-terminal dimerisation region